MIETDSTPPQGPSLLLLLNMVLRHRVGIAMSGVVLALAAIGITLARPRTYSSETSFIPQSRRQSSSALSGLAAQFGVAVPGGEASTSPSFYADLASSRAILSTLVDSQFTYHRDGVERRGPLADALDIRPKPPLERRDETLKSLANAVTAVADQRTSVVTVSVSAREPKLAQEIAQRLVAAINRFNLTTRQSQASAERQFTEERLAQARADLHQAEDALEQFNERNRTYGSAELRLQEDRLSREVVLRQQLYSTLAQAYEQARIDEVRDTPVISEIDTPELPIRPESRHLLLKALLAGVIGVVLGIVVAIGAERFGETAPNLQNEAQEFDALWRETRRDVRHPFAAVRRTFRGNGRNTSPDSASGSRGPSSEARIVS